MCPPKVSNGSTATWWASILGLVLFTIYANDLLSVPKYCKSVCYVDDSKLYLSFPSSNVSTVIDNLNMNLDNVTFCNLSNVQGVSKVRSDCKLYFARSI